MQRYKHRLSKANMSAIVRMYVPTGGSKDSPQLKKPGRWTAERCEISVRDYGTIFHIRMISSTHRQTAIHHTKSHDQLRNAACPYHHKVLLTTHNFWKTGIVSALCVSGAFSLCSRDRQGSVIQDDINKVGEHSDSSRKNRCSEDDQGTSQPALQWNRIIGCQYYALSPL